ncbi:TlpA disulfide reductase family protein [Mucilaginibacter auburnensis]|uniref:Peroxiredoxin n=1 Tax=Mucilaginibacter auburnensis TaxID=1457233 RepID=A0A2H9VMY6_9SPHI|nr:TlpA disulfide reductase family protein [Mucilaginibacter auburnensis]PJJ79697.1 peroxiredoxin [Mucilaginibacter auburnensis]
MVYILSIIYRRKALFIAAVSLLFITSTHAQTLLKKHIKITAHIKGLTNGRYYINSTSQSGIDSCNAKNGALVFNYFGEPAGLLIASTKDNGGDGKSFCSPAFWVDNSDVVITGKVEEITSMEVSGSEINVKLHQIQTLVTPLKEERTQFLVASKFTEADSIRRVITELYKTEILRNLNNVYGMILLNHLALTKLLNPSEVEHLLNMFDGKLKDSQYTRSVKGIQKNSSALGIGKLAPDFVQSDKNNKNVALSDYRGKFVLLEFWASWCGPCREENPQLVKIYKKFSKSGFEIIGVSTDVNRQTWINTIKNDNLTWPQISDLKGQGNEAAVLYNINAVPSNFLIDPDGKIIAINLLGEELSKKLSQIFPEN